MTMGGPAYRIETTRLCIRCWMPVDAVLLKAAIDPNVEYLRPWMPWVKDNVEPLEARLAWLRTTRSEFDRDADFTYGIFNPAETEVVGGTGLHLRQGKDAREIGYWIQEKYEGRGYATETAAALTRVAFEIDKVKRVHICCSVANSKSARIPEKLGFQKEGVLRKRIPKPGGDLDAMAIWTMVDDDYPNSGLPSTQLRAFDALGRQLL
jgi:RimJ/RimL family protein N-acetyltransferase